MGPKDDDELKLEWSDDPPDSDDDEENAKKKKKSKAESKAADAESDDDDVGGGGVGAGPGQGQQSGVVDIMAQQLKFIACLKIMMEELSTLATGKFTIFLNFDQTKIMVNLSIH